ncbi:MAG: ribosomal RNA small subunit methyltransferase A [Deltaproteobacteria bacterium]|nr:ribosomal RNA small subunit methyltransferase A [Deltaproteobacteria bacterium]MBN2688264.1 ribosomal RNA small subunit methyltransferase A [Deltaproteobacteria bacterium]
MTSPVGILKKYRIRPYKGRGQSFLIDPNIIEKIVESAELTGRETVLEIGAGIGFMTGMIADRAAKVVALEIDRMLLSVLNDELAHRSNVKIMQQDILTYDVSQAASKFEVGSGSKAKITVIGNIPYNISSQILFRLIDFRKVISSMVLMFQREVAERITAIPGTKEYSLLSVITSMYTRASRVMIVPASCFHPSPKVESAVLRFVVRDRPAVELKDEEQFFRLVKTAFSMRRKTLANNLKDSRLLSRGYGRETSSVFHEAEIDGGRRAETLTVEEFGRLSNVISSIQKP